MRPTHLAIMLMDVQVPHGAPPGALLTVQAPTGQLIQVQVPAGVGPGQVLRVRRQARIAVGRQLCADLARIN